MEQQYVLYCMCVCACIPISLFSFPLQMMTILTHTMQHTLSLTMVRDALQVTKSCVFQPTCLLLSGMLCLITFPSDIPSPPSLTEDYSPSSTTTMAHPAPRTHTYRPLAKSPSDNGGHLGPREPSPSPVPPPPPPMPSLLQLRARDSDRDKDAPDM